MACDACTELLSSKLDGNLSLVQAQKLEKMLVDCPDCQQAWSGMREADRLLKGAVIADPGPADPRAFSAAVLGRIAASGLTLQADPADRRLKLPDYPWSPRVVWASRLLWGNVIGSAVLSFALIAWLWLTETLLTNSGATTSRLQLVQHSFSQLVSAVQFSTILSLVVFAAALAAFWYMVVHVVRHRVGEWEASE